MLDGTVLLWRFNENWRGFGRLLGKAILFFTKQPYVHAALYFAGEQWEETGGGAKRGPFAGADELWEPVTPMTAYEIEGMRGYLEYATRSRWIYNAGRLFILLIVYPTRHFWRWIGWVPFSALMFGEVCSTFVDEAWKMAGRDLLPGELEHYTTPGDLRTSSLLRQVI